jgi:hypothetical protein
LAEESGDEGGLADAAEAASDGGDQQVQGGCGQVAQPVFMLDQAPSTGLW